MLAASVLIPLILYLSYSYLTFSIMVIIIIIFFILIIFIIIINCLPYWLFFLATFKDPLEACY
ncbi:hypothetical protein F5888DRAFT_1701343 [Russula emetica]|nr:hypothetical protein F5888DRAFT_1701343 [Russula emetica]